MIKNVSENLRICEELAKIGTDNEILCSVVLNARAKALSMAADPASFIKAHSPESLSQNVHVEVEAVPIAFTIDGLSFDALTADKELKQTFTAKVTKDIASQAGVTPSAVNVKLKPGSVEVDAVVQGGDDNHKVHAKLSGVLAQNSLNNTIAKTVNSLPGIDKVVIPGHKIEVSGLTVQPPQKTTVHHDYVNTLESNESDVDSEHHVSEQWSDNEQRPSSDRESQSAEEDDAIDGWTIRDSDSGRRIGAGSIVSLDPARPGPPPEKQDEVQSHLGSKEEPNQIAEFNQSDNGGIREPAARQFTTNQLLPHWARAPPGSIHMRPPPFFIPPAQLHSDFQEASFQAPSLGINDDTYEQTNCLQFARVESPKEMILWRGRADDDEEDEQAQQAQQEEEDEHATHEKQAQESLSDIGYGPGEEPDNDSVLQELLKFPVEGAMGDLKRNKWDAKPLRDQLEHEQDELQDAISAHEPQFSTITSKGASCSSGDALFRRGSSVPIASGRRGFPSWAQSDQQRMEGDLWFLRKHGPDSSSPSTGETYVPCLVIDSPTRPHEGGPHVLPLFPAGILQSPKNPPERLGMLQPERLG